MQKNKFLYKIRDKIYFNKAAITSTKGPNSKLPGFIVHLILQLYLLFYIEVLIAGQQEIYKFMYIIYFLRKIIVKTVDFKRLTFISLATASFDIDSVW